jgi:hypothetical protein
MGVSLKIYKDSLVSPGSSVEGDFNLNSYLVQVPRKGPPRKFRWKDSGPIPGRQSQRKQIFVDS